MVQVTKEKVQKICFQKILKDWQKQENSFPDFLEKISEEQKTINETLLTKFMEKFQQVMSRSTKGVLEEAAWKTEAETAILQYIKQEQILHVSEWIDDELFVAFERESSKFVRMTRKFDKKLSMENIWQALRNYFIYAMIMNLQGEKQICTDAILAYSLLYPYTDNFIDGTIHKKAEKAHYNAVIREVLCGEHTVCQNETEQKTKELLEMLLDSYDGKNREMASTILLLMLDAQEESMKQQGGVFRRRLKKEEISQISAYKGGVSVLFDYFLCRGEVTETQMEFYLAFGFILQMADDLQDIEEDRKKHMQTLVTRAYTERRLEQEINRQFHFIHTTIQNYMPPNPELKEFVVKSSYLMILSAVATGQKYFSKAYVKQIEEYLPFHISYLKQFSGNKQNISGAARMPEQAMQKLDLLLQ